MRYHNFDLWVDKKDKASLEYHLRANIEAFDSATGRMQLDPDSAGIANALERFDRRDTDYQFLVKIGTDLYKSLFSGEGHNIGVLFQRCLGKFLPTEGICLRLRIDAPEIAALPWEFLYLPDDQRFLSTWIHTPLVRYLDVGMTVPELTTETPIRILLVIPSCPHLDAAKEEGLLRGALQGMEPQVEIASRLKGDVSLDQIEEALQEKRFHIFHFIGHGDFAGNQGLLRLSSETVDDETLGQLFQNHEDMKLVVLNVCKGAKTSPSKPFMGIAPQLVKRGVPAVVAMQYSIYDDVAVQFSREFYHSLFKSKHCGRIDMAVTDARNSLCMHYPNERAFGAPVLFLRSPKGVLFDLPAEKKRPPLLISVSEANRLEAVAQTIDHNISVIKESEVDMPTKTAQIQDAEEKIRQIKQTLRYRKVSLVTAIAVALLVFFLFWMNVFDYLTWDPKIESYTIALGNRFAYKEFHEDIVMISINEQTEKELRRPYKRPWGPWRQDYARLIRNLTEAGAKVIVFDMFFERSSESDGALAEAMRGAKEHGTSVIVGVQRFEEGKPVLVEELRSASSGWGAAVVGTKIGYAWVAPLTIKKKQVPQPVPGLSLQAYAAYKGADKVQVLDFDQKRNQILVEFDTEEQHLEKLGFFYLEKGSEAQPSPIIGKGDIVANLAIDLMPLSMLRDKSRRYPYTDILNHSNPDMLTQFKDKIVMVGCELEGIDFHEDRWGLELHADAVNTLLNGVVIRSVAPGGQFALIVIFSIIGAIFRTRIRHASRLLPILLLSAVVLGYLAGTIFLYVQYHLLLNTMHHIVALFLTYWVVGKLERKCFV